MKRTIWFIAGLAAVILIAGLVFSGTVTKGTLGKQDIRLWYSGDSAQTFTRTTSQGYTMTLTPLDWVGIDVHAVYAGGTTRTGTIITTAASDVGYSTKRQMFVGPGTWTISANCNIGDYDDLIWHFAVGAELSIATGVTVTFPSPNNIVTASKLPQRIFTGAGSVSFAKAGTAYPEWWGIDGTADQVEINKAFTSLAGGGKVELLQASYTVAAAIAPTTKTTLSISPTTTINLANSANANVVSIAVNDVIVTGGGTIDGNGANQTTTSNGIYITSSRVKVTDLTIIDCWWAGVNTEGLVGAHISDIRIENCDISDCDDNAVRVGNWTDRTKIVNNYIHGNGVANTGGNRRGISTLQYDTDLLIQGNTVSSNYENGIYVWTDCTGVKIIDNYVASNNHFGIETASAGCLIKGNHIVSNGGQTVDDGGIYPYSKNIVEGNFVDGNLNHGIYVYGQLYTIVSGNLVRNTATGGGTPNGIRFYDPTNCLAIGNIAFDDQTPATQTWGMTITEIGGVTGTPLIGNILKNNTNNYIYGASEETPLVGNIHSAPGYELGGRDRANAYVATISGTQTFDAASYRTMFLNGGAGERAVNPTGTFRAGADIWLNNTGSTNDLVFDSSALHQHLTPGQTGHFVYNGTTWVKMYVG